MRASCLTFILCASELRLLLTDKSWVLYNHTEDTVLFFFFPTSEEVKIANNFPEVSKGRPEDGAVSAGLGKQG